VTSVASGPVPDDPTLDLIAVYGSLLRAEGMLTTIGATPHLRFLGPASVPGKLFDLGAYPGLQWTPDASTFTVPGELFEIVDPRVLSILDEYEGCPFGAPTPAPFVRRPVRLIDPPVIAWVYFYEGPVEDRPRVIGTSWPEYKARRDQSARDSAAQPEA